MERLPKLKPDQNRIYGSLCLSHDLQNPLKNYQLNEAMSVSNSQLLDCCVGWENRG